MADERWDRQWTIFHNALERPDSERTAYVESECGDDAELLATVRKLIDAHQNADSLLSDAPLLSDDSLDALRPEAILGEQIGNYVIREVIGEGGMGVVYAADQVGAVERQVALKVIKLGMDTREVVRRFEMERQSLAVMNHPNIAKVYEAGATSGGRPYFVMEYVDGMSITDYCNENRLTIDERLSVFRDVCEGIQHAHQKGVIHRDIKPSNVLVDTSSDSQAIAKIIDFGIAKATDKRATEKTVFTGLGRLVGTPAYMSPEQANLTDGDVDTRSDIYSLCVLLYELVVGRPPFEQQSLLSAGYAELQRIIREQDPPKPSVRLSHLEVDTVSGFATERRVSTRSLRRELSGDLDWIIMKGLEKLPARRYATAGALADDITRYLHNETITARPPSRTYRIGKFVRRHRWGVAVSAAVAALVIGFTIATAIQSEKLARALDTAIAQREKSDQITQFIVRLMQESDPDVSDGEDITIRAALDKGAERLQEDLGGQPEVKIEVLTHMAEVYRELGYYDKARELLDQALAIVETDLTEAQGLADPHLISDVHQTIGALAHDMGDFADAELHYRTALELRQTGSEPHEELWMTYNNLGVLLSDMGKYTEATGLLDQGLKLALATYDAPHESIALSLLDAAYNGYLSGETESVGPLFAEGVEMTRQVHGDESLRYATSLNYYAIFLKSRSNFDDAVDMLYKALPIYRKILGNNHAYTATTLNNIGSALGEAGRLAEAETVYTEALKIYRSSFDGPHPNKAAAEYNLAYNLYRQGRYEEAEPGYRRAYEEDLATSGKDHPRLASDLGLIGLTLLKLGRIDEALDTHRQEFDISERAYETDNPRRSIALVHMATTLVALNRLDEAETYIDDAAETVVGVEPEHKLSLGVSDARAALRMGQARFEESISLYNEIITLRRNSLPSNHPDLAKSLHNLGSALLSSGDQDVHEETIAAFKEALDIREITLGTNHPDTVASRLAYTDQAR
jgi:serine/threonine protein kinase/tetratricopeptide (TPR) repeat protein